MSDKPHELLDHGIAARNLSKRVDGRVLFRGLDLSVPRGSIYGLIGASGSGKTALLRVLATLDAADSGDIFICGVSVNTHLQEARRNLAYMPQTFVAYDGMTVTAYLDFYALAQGVSGTDRPAVRDALLDLLDLSSALREPVRHLSPDQRQRLSLARCLIHDPEVLLLDDPAAGLSDEGILALSTILQDLAGLGKTVLLTSRSTDYASAVSHELVSVTDITAGPVVVAAASENAH